MPALPLSEAIQHAHEAISGGNYRSAVETCRRVLDQYPDFASAYQLLGEASLEQRDVDEAERAFQETLRRDPQNLAAYLGLGLIAEEHADPQRALAYVQAAWEIFPQRADLRDHVVRLSQQLYGVEGRLQLTRAALASLHYLSGRWTRAVAESAAVLADHPTRVDVRLRLAEALWRRGEGGRAVAVCHQVLEQAPQAIGALLIMAAVERAGGNEAEATRLRDRARAIDPLGARAAEVLADALPDGLGFFVPAEAPVLEEREAPAAEPEVRRIAPAPDFTAPPPEKRVAAEALPDAAAAEAPTLSLATDAELAAARPSAGPAGEFADVLRSLEDTGLQPFQAPDFATGPASVAAAAQPAAAAQAEDLGALLQMPSDAELQAARPPEGEIHGYTGLLRSLEDTGLQPFSVEGEAVEPAEAAEEPVAAAPSTGPAESAAATPSPEAIEPLAAVASPVEEVEPAPESTAETAPAEVEPAAAAAGVAVDWDAIDDEIRRAIPGEMPHGYTEQLRSLDETGVEPFSFEGEDIPFFQRSRTAQPARAEEPAAADVLAEQPAAEPVSAEAAADVVMEQPVVEVVAEEPLAAATEAEDEVLDLGALESLDGEPLAPAAAATPVSEAELVGLEPEAPTAPTAPVVEDVEVEMPAPAAVEAVAPAPGEPQPVAAGEADVEVSSVQTALDRLGVDVELFERARAAKEALVDAGRIGGRRPIGEPAPVPAAAAVAVETLAEAAASRPEDPVARLALAEALLDAGRMDAALEEYRWIYRHGPEHADRLIAGLTRIASSGEGAGVAHRLLGAIYRRRGDVQLATRHYALSLGQERQPVGRRG